MIYKINKPIRLIELFSGYGSQALALKMLCDEYDIPFKSWRTCEWEVNAIGSYKALHFGDDNKDYSEKYTKENLVDILYKLGISSDGKEPLEKKQIARKSEKWLRNVFNNIVATRNLVDISAVRGRHLGVTDTDKYEYIMSYSFPCQDVSGAGKGQGFTKGSGTRSGLLWEVERILDECKSLGDLPQILLMENVSAIHWKKHMKNFQMWIDKLDSLGYYSTWFDINSKDFGIPQNRERCFMISILNGKEGDYEPPKPFKLEMRLRDVLEDEVEDKYYLNDEMVKRLNTTTYTSGGYDGRVTSGGGHMPNVMCQRLQRSEMCRTGEFPLARQKTFPITQKISPIIPKTPNDINPHPHRLFNVFGENKGTGYAGNVWDKDFVSPTINTSQGGWRQPLIVEV